MGATSLLALFTQFSQRNRAKPLNIMQVQTAQLTLREVCDRLDRLPTSWFHAKILVVAGLSLLFDVLDTAVTGFVLASLRPLWHFDVKTIGTVSTLFSIFVDEMLTPSGRSFGSSTTSPPTSVRFTRTSVA